MLPKGKPPTHELAGRTDEGAERLMGPDELGAERQRPKGAAPAPFTCPIHPNSPDMANIGHVPFLPRSALACWWSIMHLIRTSSPCYLWTFTMGSGPVQPDERMGHTHGRFVTLMKNAAQRQTPGPHGGTIPRNWGGVKVIEEHPGGHGLHAHWVARGRMPWHTVQHLAVKAGFGYIVHVDPRPATEASAFYLASYLTKGGKLRGLRQWGNVGTYDGIGKRDIHQTSARIERIKMMMAYYRALGKHRFVAYRLALQDEQLREPDSDVPF